jgi:hypothetical protein
LGGQRDFLLGCLVALEDRIRQVSVANIKTVERLIPGTDPQQLPVAVLASIPPWSQNRSVEREIPGMITPEEARYYQWLGKFYSGAGEVVELGPWLGKSTMAILDGIESSGRFQGRKLHVYEDFVWRSSFMDLYVPPELRRKDGEDFYPLFQKMTSSKAALIDARPCAIQVQKWNSHLPRLKWDGQLIEIIYVDCGRAFLENQTWYELFAPFFIPRVTLIVMQDWRTHREIPRKPFNHTLQFTESKGSALQLIHETENGGIGTFLWLGQE